MECLRQDNAIKLIIVDVRSMTEIRDDRRKWVAIVYVQNIPLGYTVRAERTRIGIVSNFKHSTPNIELILTQKPLNVISIDWLSAVKAEVTAQRSGSTKMSKANVSNPGPPQPTHSSRYASGCRQSCLHWICPSLCVLTWILEP